MTGLIPLALGTESASSGGRFSMYYPEHDHALRRFGVVYSKDAPNPMRPSAWKPAPTTDASARASQWPVPLDDIKRSFLHDDFRACYSRCHEALKHSETLDGIQPAYLVYLRFFAAMASEMQARHAPRTSPSRHGLLQQAQAHYRVAAGIAKREDETLVASTPPPPSVRVASPSPSDKTISTDDSSPPSTPTRVASPVLSASSTIDGCSPSKGSSPAGKRKKKRVAFRDVPIMEPYIRPDSPTLGFDDWLGRSSPEPFYPESILKHGHNMSECQEEPLPLTATPELIREDESVEDPLCCQDTFGPQYRVVLASIRCQIEKHMATLDGELESGQGQSSASEPVDIGTRIERLRACGWRRRRFDARKYQNLCENVLAELNS
ncbi:hypothetical protein JDV02_001085 [Purpureocillium takamizusanense]|uniref:Uncharacterized protein n=1 Tax=Purpureocillium takamizusanense TaxID=2060973 RepID=A0A9Q8Q861_9HYPO|nr:uncharacterized protein JDV02_001085 [Purpureocillium takamizusanense]UNI14456.1 hypothetical protein JDV02_001085 [Purpureocillium takamizusanense]